MEMTKQHTLDAFKFLSKQCEHGKSPKAYKLLEVAVHIFPQHPKIEEAREPKDGSSKLESIYYSVGAHVRALKKGKKLVKVGPGKYRVAKK